MKKSKTFLALAKFFKVSFS